MASMPCCSTASLGILCRGLPRRGQCGGDGAGVLYFTDSRYIEAANHLITGAEIAMTGRSRNYRAMVQEVVDRCRIRKLGFEEGYLSVADYNLWKEGSPPSWCPPRSW